MRKISTEQRIRSLGKKGVIVNERSKTVDLKRGRELGNGSFGHINFFTKMGFSVFGMSEYKSQFQKSEEKQPILIPNIKQLLKS